MARAGNWRGRRGGAQGPPSRSRRPRPPQPDAGELIARLDRLESVVMAIAARLGIEARHPRQGGPRRSEVRREDGRRDDLRRDDVRGDAATTDPHAVVRTVARGLSGRIKQYHPGRSFGFVVSPDTPGDVFFHRSDCRTDPAALEPSATVTFDLVEMANGHVKAMNLAPRS